MNSARKEILIRNRVKLIENIQMEDGLWNYLLQKKLITPRQKSRLTHNKDTYSQAEELLDLLPKLGPRAFDIFCDALIESNQRDLVDSVLKPLQETHPAVMETGAGSTEFAGVQPEIQQMTTKMNHCNVKDTDDFPDAMREDINIIPCMQGFYEDQKHFSYPISKPRGLALIINVNKFAGSREPRLGTDVDAHNLTLLWRELGFNVKRYNDDDDLTAQGIKDKLLDFASDSEHQYYQCAVVCILSHGEDNSIIGSDRKEIEVDKIIEYFLEKNCPSLAGKPKLFFFQACRGGQYNEGVNVPCHQSDDAHDALGWQEKAGCADLLLAFPTQKGDFAFRNKITGSWFIQAIVDVFSKHSHHLDLCSMLHLVNDKVSRRYSKCNKDVKMDHKFQMSEFKSTLTKARLHFFPGH